MQAHSINSVLLSTIMSIALDTSFSATQRVRDVRPTFIQQIAMKTPVLSRLAKAPKPMSSTPEWPIKTYSAPVLTGVLDGVDPDFTAVGENNLANKAMLLGRYQASARYPAVSKFGNLLAKQYAVPTDAMQDNVKDKTLEHHVDIESVILSDNESVLQISNTTASLTRSIGRAISNANSRFTDTATTPPTAYRTPATSIVVSKATASAVLESDIQGLTQSVAIARKEALTSFWGVCKPEMKAQFTNFTRTDLNGSSSSTFPVRRFNQAEGGTITMNVTRYESDFGDIDLTVNYRLDPSILFLLLDMDMVEIGYAQAPKYEEFPFQGGIRRGMVDSIYVCEVLNPQSHGKIITGAVA